MKKSIIISTVLALFITLLVLSIWALSNHHLFNILDQYLYGNKSHNLTCDQLPTVEEVDKVVNEHHNEILNIINGATESASISDQPVISKSYGLESNGYINVFWGEGMECLGTGHGDILFEFPGERQKQYIENTINSPTFYGIPYRLRNV